MPSSFIEKQSFTDLREKLTSKRVLLQAVAHQEHIVNIISLRYTEVLISILCMVLSRSVDVCKSYTRFKLNLIKT